MPKEPGDEDNPCWEDEHEHYGKKTGFGYGGAQNFIPAMPPESEDQSSDDSNSE